MTILGVMSTQDAVTRIHEDLLDDPNKRRWSDTQVMRAIRAAHDKCILEYLQKGGSRLRRIDQLTTDANGEATLVGGYQPEHILWVVRSEGEIREELEPVAYKDVVLFDDAAGSVLEVCYPNVTPIASLTPSAGTKLITVPVGTGSVDAEGGLYSLEDWIVKRAAAELAVKDVARYPVLKDVALEAKRVALDPLPTMVAGGFDGTPRYSQDYRWTWTGEKIRLVRWA